MAGKRKASGGPRTGAGRPPKKLKAAPPAPKPAPPPIDWRSVSEAAEAGADETEIIRALGISELALEDPANLTRFRDDIARGHARYKLELRKIIKARGQKTTRSAGSVNALALQARNLLDWDKQIPTQEVEPDLGTARQRLRDLFVKLALARSEVEGRTVTALELLHREAQADVQTEGQRVAE